MRDTKSEALRKSSARRGRKEKKAEAITPEMPVLGYAVVPHDPAPIHTTMSRARTQEVIGRLTARADRSPGDATFIVALLDAVSRAADERVASAPMPVDEQRVWESVGARFDDAEALTRARARGISAYAGLLARSARGDTAMAKTLGVDTSRVSQRVRERSLYFIVDDDVRFYPLWQLNVRGNGTVPGLKEVVRALDVNLHPLVVDHWFTSPSNELQIGDDDVSPADWLRTGGPSAPIAHLAALL